MCNAGGARATSRLHAGPRGGAPGAWIGRVVRRPALWVTCLPSVRRREIERLFIRTAAAFQCPAPAHPTRRVKELLREYARFTNEQAEAALGRGAGRSDLARRLFRVTFGIGGGYRIRLGVRSRQEAVTAARYIYRALGIDFRSAADGTIRVNRCAFASVYAPQVCALVSALDRGLLAGLTAGGELSFTERLTDGALACTGHLSGGVR